MPLNGLSSNIKFLAPCSAQIGITPSRLFWMDSIKANSPRNLLRGSSFKLEVTKTNKYLHLLKTYSIVDISDCTSGINSSIRITSRNRVHVSEMEFLTNCCLNSMAKSLSSSACSNRMSYVSVKQKFKKKHIT